MLFKLAGSENQERREVNKMKKTISLLSYLLLSSILFWGAPRVEANELVDSEVADVGGYCHMKFAPMEEATLSWAQPELSAEAEKSIDFYGPCDYDPTGAAEIKAQRALLLRDLFGDGSSDGE
jgi:hypothetical protein